MEGKEMTKILFISKTNQANSKATDDRMNKKIRKKACKNRQMKGLRLNNLLTYTQRRK
jgi:hypothetical protein